MPIVDFESDKVLTRTLMNNFENLLVFIFYSQWSEESQAYVKSIENTIEMFGEYENAKFFSISAEKCPETYNKYDIQQCPTVIFTQTDKKILAKLPNEIPATVFQKLEQHLNKFKENFRVEKEKWYPKIQNILNSCPFIIFIKGTPTNPKCGFTSTLLQILAKHNIQYTFYDIIADQYMRYWLRNYNKWPTYPQIYIKGKLIGGLDIIKQLVANGKFQEIIPASSKRLQGNDRLEKLLQEEETEIFIDGFPFENQQSKEFVDLARQKFGANISIFNVRIDQKISSHFQSKGIQVPCAFHKKTLVTL